MGIEGYLVRFIRKDGHQEEEYYYNTYNEATEHLRAFNNDDSGLYDRIVIERYSNSQILKTLSF